MKFKMMMLAGVLMASGTLLAADAQEAKPALKDSKDKLGYAIGMSMGGAWKRQGLEVNLDMVARGLKDSMSGGPTLITEDELKETLMNAQKDMAAKQQEKAKVQGDKNKKEGEAFLEANKKKEGVKTTASGLQYKVLKEGDGSKPGLTNTVVTHYRGTLIDGTEFDSSYKRNEPATFPVQGVIKGWTEALQLMKAGAKYQIFIPSELAYAERGAGPDIGPNATLIFEMELLEVK